MERENTMHIVILGAGLMGRLLACQLARAGHRLEVFDAGGPLGPTAARAAAAMLAPKPLWLRRAWAYRLCC
jgi:glycine oxidase